MKPILALDIDGTITSEHGHIPEEVLKKLSSFQERGGELLFITGRSFVRSAKLFERIKSPFHLAVLNGAQIFKMPEKKCIYSQLIAKETLLRFEEIASQVGTGAVFYTGVIDSDLCYFRKKRFSKEMQEYLEKRTSLFGEQWIDLEERPFPIEECAAIKTFGTKELLGDLAKKLIERKLLLDFCILQDRYLRSSSVGLATRHDVTKGSALEHFIGHLGGASLVVAAGDDLNDLSMLQSADIKITFEGAPNDDLFLQQFFYMLTILALLIGAMLLTSWFVKRISSRRVDKLNDESEIKILDERSLSPRTQLYVIEVEGKKHLVAESMGGYSSIEPLTSRFTE